MAVDIGDVKEMENALINEMENNDEFD